MYMLRNAYKDFLHCYNSYIKNSDSFLILKCCNYGLSHANIY